MIQNKMEKVKENSEVDGCHRGKKLEAVIN